MRDNLVPRSQRSWMKCNVTSAQKDSLNLTDKRRSPKCKENWQKLLFLGIQTGDKWAKPPFFVTYSQLCRHCRNLAEGGCLLPLFHFTLCHYFLGHVPLWNLPRTGPHYTIDSIFCYYLLGLWVNTSPFSRVSMHWETISRDQLLSWILAELPRAKRAQRSTMDNKIW